jgi:riboflavin kinase
MKSDSEILLFIAEHAGLHRPLEMTTTSLAKNLGLSQQSISRRLIFLEKSGYITRKAKTTGIIMQLKEKGIDRLQKMHERLDRVLKPAHSLSGKVVLGFGEGRYYVSLPQYRKEFQEKLNIDPYPGTLNIKINIDSLKGFLFNTKCINISGFSDKSRSFGDIESFLISVQGIKCAIIIPQRSAHEENIIEIISHEHLRKKLNLDVGSSVTMEK